MEDRYRCSWRIHETICSRGRKWYYWSGWYGWWSVWQCPRVWRWRTIQSRQWRQRRGMEWWRRWGTIFGWRLRTGTWNRNWTQGKGKNGRRIVQIGLWRYCGGNADTFQISYGTKEWLWIIHNGNIVCARYDIETIRFLKEISPVQWRWICSPFQ